MRDKVTRQCPQFTAFEEKGEPKRIRTEVPPLTSLTNALPLGQTGSETYFIVSASAFILTCVSLLLQRQQPVSSDEKDVMTLLSLLLSMRRQRKHSPDVIPETDDVMGRDVRLRKRQRQCYWSVVTCYWWRHGERFQQRYESALSTMTSLLRLSCPAAWRHPSDDIDMIEHCTLEKPSA